MKRVENRRETRLDWVRNQRTLGGEADELVGNGLGLLGGRLKELEEGLKKDWVRRGQEGEWKGTVYSATLTEFQRRRYAHLQEGGRNGGKKWLLTSVLLNVANITPGE